MAVMGLIHQMGVFVDRLARRLMDIKKISAQAVTSLYAAGFSRDYLFPFSFHLLQLFHGK